MRYHFFLTIVTSRLLIASECVENWPSEDMKETHHKKIKEGQDITLTCAGRVKNASAFWDYKPCGGGFNRPLCSKLTDEELGGVWKPLSQNMSTLTLKEVMMSEGGLYRCRQAATPFIFIYTTIQLEVWTDRIEDAELPRFLDGLPKDSTVPTNSQAVFQCKVYSKTPASIAWTWQGEEDEADPRHGFQLGTGIWNHDPQIDLSWKIEGVEASLGGARLSRLVLPRALKDHAGRYSCIALNTKGYANASAYLRVIDENEREQPDKLCMYALFLIPVGLAIIPLTLWLCFVLIFKRRRVVTLNQSDCENMDNNEKSLI